MKRPTALLFLALSSALPVVMPAAVTAVTLVGPSSNAGVIEIDRGAQGVVRIPYGPEQAPGAALESLLQRDPSAREDLLKAVEMGAASFASSASPVSNNESGLTAALSALVAAATKASPAQSGAIATAAARGVIQQRISEAIVAAKAANPNLSAEQILLIGTQAGISPTSTAAVTAIATTVTATLLSNSGQVSPKESSAIANAIASAVNLGSSEGARNAATPALGADASRVDSPKIAIAVSFSDGGLTVSSTSLGGGVTVTSVQTVSGSRVGTLITRSQLVSRGTGPGTSTPILSPLDQTQPIVSPSRS